MMVDSDVKTIVLLNSLFRIVEISESYNIILPITIATSYKYCYVVA